MDVKTLQITNWIKNNVFTIVVAILVAIFGLYVIKTQIALSEQMEQYKNLFAEYTAQSEDFRNQISTIKTTYEEHMRAQERLNEQYQEEMADIKARHKAALTNIAQEQQRLRREILQNYEEDPTSLTRQIESVFGIPIQAPDGR